MIMVTAAPRHREVPIMTAAMKAAAVSTLSTYSLFLQVRVAYIVKHIF
jgi:hypothetical protein